LALLIVLFRLLKKLMSKELASLRSTGFNNFLFIPLVIMAGTHHRQDAFWSTFLFQLVLIVPLLVACSIDTQHRLPSHRIADWPLTSSQTFLFSIVSFCISPLFLLLLFVMLLWMGVAVAIVFLCLGFTVHLFVYLAARAQASFNRPLRLPIPRPPSKFGGIAQQLWRDLTETLDFWAALLVAIAASAYRVFGQSPNPDAFPILAVIVAITISTVAQRMFSLDDGRASLRLRLLPIAGWKLLLTQDAAFLLVLALLVSPLNLRAGCTCGLVSIAIGRYPSLTQKANQRRGRFVAGDLRFGVIQIILGGIAGIGAVRLGAWPSLAALACYVASLLMGSVLWNRHLTS
jgi:hypothetical protein